MKSGKSLNITRMDQRNTHGWYVRIYGQGKVLLQKLFSDKKYGGREMALSKAIKFRDTVKPTKRYPMQVRSHIKNKTGIIGVYKRYYRETSGNITERIVGIYYINNQQVSKSFAVQKYGEDRAWRMAEAFRKEGMLMVSSRKLKYIDNAQRLRELVPFFR
ncbi:MAG: hypothetical protein HY753_01420 [Nitrospirae bacterium]|nr:hypothetical protein [Nitrospirota bacterium]